jgi:hypothetical protein
MASADSAGREHPTHHQLPQAWVLAVLTHVGLLTICVSAAYTLQPADFSRRRWAALALLAVAALFHAAVTRGRGASGAAGRSLTALLAGAVLSLSYDPQLANWPAIGEKLPLWLASANPSLATIGVVLAGACGAIYLATVHRHHRRRHPVPYVRVVLAAALLVVVMGVGAFLALSRVYELDGLYLVMLLSNAVQYAWVLSIVLGMSGRVGVGATPQVYLALTVLAALARNVAGGGEGA